MAGVGRGGGDGRTVAGDPAPARPSRRLVGAVSLFVVALAAFGYGWTGSPGLLRQGTDGAAVAAVAAAPAPEGATSGPTGLQQIEAMVGKLAERMKDNPDDAQGWVMLARSYTVLGRLGEAIPAYARAAELQPDNPGVLADYADAVAATRGTANNPQSLALIERALKADAKYPKALALAGSAAFDRGDYAVAIADWQKIVEQLPSGSELAPRVQAMIDEARGKLGAPGTSAPTAATARTAATPATAATAATPATAATAAAPPGSVSGTVSLDPALAAQAAPDDAVFVFARAASGSRMPLAVQRARVKDLPLVFRLDDSMAMAPGMTLSSASRLTVGARISKSGNAIPQAGDLAGEATGVAPGAKDVAIRIGSVVGRP